jgi:LAO/AO transport system kinase
MLATDLQARILAGDVRAIARAISLIEDHAPEARKLLASLHASAGRATVVGITGAPGSGKSTLVDQLIAEYRRGDARVAVLAVDPTSPFTGGALLGDRIRMQRHAGDERVFIRSVASRGHVGGVTSVTREVLTVLDAAGFNPILIETVGVGQSEVDVARLADTTVVLVAPGSGDDVQALKAGLMEIADIFVVNKADRDGADKVGAAIEGMLALVESPAVAPGWRPPVLSTVATTGDGVATVAAAIAAHGETDPEARRTRRRARDATHLKQLVLSRLAERLPLADFEQAAGQVSTHAIDPWRAADALAAAITDAAPAWLDHVGVATPSLAESLSFLRDVLDLAEEPVEEIAAQQVRVQFVRGAGGAGGTAIELVEPVSALSTVARFLERRGPGLHHIAIRVADLDVTLARLRQRGVRLVDDQPRAGAHGSRVAFVHPDATHGLLIELVERAEPGRAHR